MAVASELMCPGVPVTAWASIRPRTSNTAADKSPESRTMGVKEVRCSAAACSLVTVISRVHRISRVTGPQLDGHRFPLPTVADVRGDRDPDVVPRHAALTEVPDAVPGHLGDCVAGLAPPGLAEHAREAAGELQAGRRGEHPEGGGHPG